MNWGDGLEGVLAKVLGLFLSMGDGYDIRTGMTYHHVVYRDGVDAESSCV
jgi:hypothetical protein